jgi:adenosylcobinamide kinase/adenosylcobinamide-phosphate guanylyltransferase
MLTLILGGARSGKSRHAQSLCQGANGVLFLATARPADEAMRARIARHRAERPAEWRTIEEPLAVPSVVRQSHPGTTVLLDCLTHWLANLAWEHRSLPEEEQQSRILAEVEDLARVADGRRMVVVSNEVGGGVVPENAVGRRFRDLQGMANQLLAAEAGLVVLMVAGLPMTLKGSVKESRKPSL